MSININKIYTNDELYNELFTPLFRYFSFRTKNYDTSVDLAQTTFVKFLTQEKQPDDKDHSTKLLFTIARNLLIDHYRKKSTRNTGSLEEIDIDIRDTKSNPEKDFENKEDVELVKNLLKDLSEIEKEIITLRMSTELQYTDIGKILSLSSENTRQIYSRALRKIKQKIEKENITYKT